MNRIPEWKVLEQDIVDQIGGRMTKASGAGWYDKGDGKHLLGQPLSLLWDCKYTDKSSYTINPNVWFKLEREAMYRNPALFVRLRDVDIAVVASSFASRLGMSLVDIPVVKSTVKAGMDLPSMVCVETPFGLLKSLVCIDMSNFVDAYRGFLDAHQER